MYYSPNYQYSQNNQSPFVLALSEKHQIRRTSNAVCWTMLLAVLLMSGFFVVCLYYLKAFGHEENNIWKIQPVLFYLAHGVSYLMGIAVPVFIYLSVKHIPLKNILPFNKIGGIHTMVCAFFGSAVCMLANIPANAVAEIQKSFGFSGEIPEYPMIDDPWVLALYFITVAVIPPITEELLFRGVILQSLRKFGEGFAIVGSALLFGLYHGNFIQFVFAFIAGLVMALVVVRTNSIWTSIIIHFINNSISVVLEMVKRYGGENLANLVSTVVFMVVLVLGIVSFVYLIIKNKQFFNMGKDNVYLPFSSKLGALFLNPGGIVVILFSLITSVNVLLNY